MRKVSGVICYILAGFFVYMVCLLAFVNQPTIAKWGMVAGFSLPSLFFLCLGLAVNGFRRWRRDIGIVLLSGAGSAAFVIFTSIFVFMTEEFRQIVEPDTPTFLNAYFSGGIFILSVATLGIALLRQK